MIDIRCPQCSSVWKLDDSYAGSQGHCPRCRFILDIPSSSTETNVSAGVPSENRPQAPAKQIMVWCPECRNLLMVDAVFAGLKGMCPKCRCVLMVPKEEAPPRPAFPLDLTLPPPGSPPPEPAVEDPGYEVVDEPPRTTKLEAVKDINEIQLVDIEEESEKIETLELADDDLPFVEPVVQPRPQPVAASAEVPPAPPKVEKKDRDRRWRGRRAPQKEYYQKAVREYLTETDGPSLMENIFTRARCYGLIAIAVGFFFVVFTILMRPQEEMFGQIIRVITFGAGVLSGLIGIYYTIRG